MTRPEPADRLADLDKPLARQLLRGSPLLRLAYIAADGGPRVVPVAYLWREPHIVVCSAERSAKARALRRNPAVAVTIDYDGQPSRALLIRGLASVETVDGVPQDYIDASLKTQSARGADDFAGQAVAMYKHMAQITIEPTWARLLDFETSAPREIERLAAQARQED